MDDLQMLGHLRRHAERLIRTKVDMQILADLGPSSVGQKLAAEHERLSSSVSPAALFARRRA